MKKQKNIFLLADDEILNNNDVTTGTVNFSCKIRRDSLGKQILSLEIYSEVIYFIFK